MTRTLLTLALASALALSCGGGNGGGGKDASDAVTSNDTIEPREALPLVTKQAHYTPADFLAKVEADASLQALWTKLQAEGYTAIETAGISEDEDGIEVIWGEATGKAGPLTGLLRHCKDKECTAAIFRLSSGKPSWEDKDGNAVEPKGFGLPILLKALEGHDITGPTHIYQALELPDELPEIDVTSRRFYMLSSFGPLWADSAVDTTGLADAAAASGCFDEVQHKPYVHAAEVDYVLLHSTPHEVLVWLTAGIREEAVSNKVWKAMGVTANRGLFGDVTYDYKRFGDMLEQSPLQGPGLIVLAGCETMGDGNGGEEKEKSIPAALDNGVRTFVGFERCGDARDLLEATTRFVKDYLSGATLGDSMKEANDYLKAVKSQAVMKTLASANLARTFLTKVDDYWQLYTDDGLPGDSMFTVNINIVNMCTDKDGKDYQETEAFVSAWSKEVKWDGPFFSGSRQNPANKVDLTLSGSLLDIAEEARFFFVVQGDLSPKVQDLTLYGTAVIDKIVVDKEKLDEFILEFKGQGVASPYLNEAGDQCVMQPPLLVTSTGEPSSFKIPVTFKPPQEQEE